MSEVPYERKVEVVEEWLRALFAAEVTYVRDDWWRTAAVEVLSKVNVVAPTPPLYVNHPRTEPEPGDVVRDADDGRSLSAWLYGRDGVGIMAWRGTVTGVWNLRDDLPARLRLLVDGETGQVVP